MTAYRGSPSAKWSGPPVRLASRASWLFAQVRKQIWFRSALFSIAAIAVAAFSALAGDLIPFDPSLTLASGSVGAILTVIATSMLAVTTFSLSIMVSAYASATSNVTPRSTKVLLADPVAQNTLSTFLGSFLFAILGIIGLSAGVYDERGRVLLFFATLAVLAIITVALLRWIDQLGRFGRVGDTIRRIEKAALPAIEAEGASPGLGTLPQVPIPADSKPIHSHRIGAVTHIDIGHLDELAIEQDCFVHLAVLPGSLVHGARPMIHVPQSVPDDVVEEMRRCVTVYHSREFEQDPRFGFVVLAEIASRAMSPAVNDPGTAIDVLGTMLRLFAAFSEARADASSPRCERVHGPALAVDDLMSTAIEPIARDSSGNLEVLARILAVLSALAKLDPGLFGDASKGTARRTLEIAWQGQPADWFRSSLADLAAKHGFERPGD